MSTTSQAQAPYPRVTRLRFFVLCKRLKQLEADIEDLRQHLHREGMAKGLSHEDVLAVSQRLDVLIIRHYRLAKYLEHAGLNTRRSFFRVSR